MEGGWVDGQTGGKKEVDGRMDRVQKSGHAGRNGYADEGRQVGQLDRQEQTGWRRGEGWTVSDGSPKG